MKQDGMKLLSGAPDEQVIVLFGIVQHGPHSTPSGQLWDV